MVPAILQTTPTILTALDMLATSALKSILSVKMSPVAPEMEAEVAMLQSLLKDCAIEGPHLE